MAATGLSNKAIGQRLDTPRQIVSKWRKRFFERGMEGPADNPRPGGAPIHRGEPCVERFRRQWPNARVLHTPIHASRLNQVEVCFSIVQRKALSPNHFENLAQVERRLQNFERYYEQVAKPFEWKFTRQDLRDILNRLKNTKPPVAADA